MSSLKPNGQNEMAGAFYFFDLEFFPVPRALVFLFHLLLLKNHSRHISLLRPKKN